MRDLQRRHVHHHYKDHEHGFGISSVLYDVLFGTYKCMSCLLTACEGLLAICKHVWTCSLVLHTSLVLIQWLAHAFCSARYPSLAIMFCALRRSLSDQVQ